MGRYRHIGIKVFIFLLILPFLTITDFYPFMRFGMFAEPIRTYAQLETYRLGIFKNKSIQIVNMDSLGLSEGKFNYLARTYIHTHRQNQLLRTFWGKLSQEKDSLYLFKIHGMPLDTHIVTRFAP